jgi:PAS domain S-box-containing protein
MIFDICPGTLLVTDSSGEILAVNKKIKSVFGITENKIIGEYLQELPVLTDTSRGRVRDDFKRIGAGKNVLSHKINFISKSGEPKEGLLNTNMLQGEYNKIFGNVLTVVDINEGYKARNSLKFFRKIMDKTRDEIYVIDIFSGRLIDYNVRACQDLGYSRIELEGSLYPVEVNMSLHAFFEEDYLVYIARDISERKNIKAGLVKSESKYRDLFEASRDAVIMFDKNKIIDCNSAAVKLFKLKSKKEMLNQKLSNLCPKYQLSGKSSVDMEKNIFETVRKKGSSLFSCNYKKSDDAVFPAEVLMTSFKDNGEKLFQALIRDVSEHEKNLDELKKDQEIFQFLAKNAKDVIFIYSFFPKNKFDYISPSVEKITGYSQKNLYAHPDIVFKLIEPEDRRKIENLRFFSERKKTITLRIHSKADSIIWFELKSHNIYSRNGMIIGVQGIARDITEKKIYEEKFNDAQTRLNLALEGAKEGFWDWDIKTGFIYYNNMGLSLLGYKRSEFKPHIKDLKKISIMNQSIE